MDFLTEFNDIFTEQGTTGLVRFSGYIYEEFHRDLQGPNAARIWHEIQRNEPAAGPFLARLDLAIRKMQWTATPSDADLEGKWSKFLTENMNDMHDSWMDTLTELNTCPVYGFYLGYEKYRRRSHDEGSAYDDGLIGWHKIAPRSQRSIERWLFDEDTDSYVGVSQHTRAGNRALIPLDRCLHVVWRKQLGNPEGLSVFRSIFTSYMALKLLRWVEATAYERDVGGMPLFEVPPAMLADGASAGDKSLVRSLSRIAAKMRRSEWGGGVIPSSRDARGEATGHGLRFAETQSMDGIVGIRAAISAYESHISQNLATEFTRMGADGQGGSRAMHTDKTTQWTSFVDGIADTYCSAFNRQSVPRLMTLNGVPRDMWPRLGHSPAAEVDPLAVAQTYGELVSSGGIVPTEHDEHYLRRTTGLPLSVEDEGL